ncbi:MAG: AI-2E family transporter [Coleofasciculus sp. G3-WIS-01]|uniref:AI-2E family transporter n=1 Tax=Coleofasciculus sp. G3-WIS-01 TaxID=3069528 RepID=UPI0032F50ED8
MTGEGIVANNSKITQAVPMRVSGKTIQILLAIIATILAIAALKATSAKVINAVAKMSDKLRGYILIQSLTCVLTGLLTGLWCWMLGVDFALVWGLVAFVLNYIPTLGSIVAVIPPTLLALIFLGIGRGVATLVGLAVIQVFLGNFVDPRLQGRTLKLSPFVALLSIVFWGWVWGIPGALLGIPMTMSVIVLSQEFESTRAIALLFGDTDDPELKEN